MDWGSVDADLGIRIDGKVLINNIETLPKQNLSEKKMKITKRQLKELINEQYAAVARGGASPMKSRASREFTRALKGEGVQKQDWADAIDDLTMDLINLFNQTNYVDLHSDDLARAVFDALSYNNLVSRQEVLKAFGRVIYSEDEGGFR